MPALQTVPVALMAAQATSDDDMVALWLGNFRSPGTRRAYASDVRAFRAFVAMPLRSVALRDVQAYGASVDHLAAATVCRRLSSVKSLIAMAHRLGYLAFDVGAPMQLPSIRDTLAERIISEEDVQHLFWCEKRLRNAALIRLIYSAGLRVSEACGLRWRDFVARDGGGQISVFGKGGKTRVVLLPEPIWARITQLRVNSGPDDAVFRSRNGGPVQPRQVGRIVKRAARRAKLGDNVSPHFLRHAHISHALDRGAPVHVVRATVGHASLETTTRYSHARPDDSSARYLNA